MIFVMIMIDLGDFGIPEPHCIIDVRVPRGKKGVLKYNKKLRSGVSDWGKSKTV